MYYVCVTDKLYSMYMCVVCLYVAGVYVRIVYICCAFVLILGPNEAAGEWTGVPALPLCGAPRPEA